MHTIFFLRNSDTGKGHFGVRTCSNFNVRIGSNEHVDQINEEH